jgi:hypothetical protein
MDGKSTYLLSFARDLASHVLTFLFSLKLQHAISQDVAYISRSGQAYYVSKINI